MLHSFMYHPGLVQETHLRQHYDGTQSEPTLCMTKIICVVKDA
jgi:hypothetical protein